MLGPEGPEGPESPDGSGPEMAFVAWQNQQKSMLCEARDVRARLACLSGAGADLRPQSSRQNNAKQCHKYKQCLRCRNLLATQNGLCEPAVRLMWMRGQQDRLISCSGRKKSTCIESWWWSTSLAQRVYYSLADQISNPSPSNSLVAGFTLHLIAVCRQLSSTSSFLPDWTTSTAQLLHITEHSHGHHWDSGQLKTLLGFIFVIAESQGQQRRTSHLELCLKHTVTLRLCMQHMISLSKLCFKPQTSKCLDLERWRLPRHWPGLYWQMLILFTVSVCVCMYCLCLEAYLCN